MGRWNMQVSSLKAQLELLTHIRSNDFDDDDLNRKLEDIDNHMEELFNMISEADSIMDELEADAEDEDEDEDDDDSVDDEDDDEELE